MRRGQRRKGQNVPKVLERRCFPLANLMPRLVSAIDNSAREEGEYSLSLFSHIPAPEQEAREQQGFPDLQQRCLHLQEWFDGSAASLLESRAKGAEERSRRGETPGRERFRSEPFERAEDSRVLLPARKDRAI